MWGPRKQYTCATGPIDSYGRDRASVGQDYRALYELYSELFGDRPARCMVNDSSIGCDGTAPDSCQRFAGARVKDQSAHDASCSKSKCSRLFWDELSYRSVNGARAVCLDKTDNKMLRYRLASGRTLAISHVWSHGQGGRPELEGGSGFNLCLHQRYVSIARAAGCDSYWMDTPCIPGDHQLRHEAIANINKVFSECKLTLICDRDLMDADIGIESPQAEISNRESEGEGGTDNPALFRAALFVCDWNVRAWTFLESMRGRRNVHILCKNNMILLVNDTI